MHNNAPTKQQAFIIGDRAAQPRMRIAYRTAKRVVTMHKPSNVVVYTGAQAIAVVNKV